MRIFLISIPIAAMGIGWAWLGSGGSAAQMRFQMPARELAAKLGNSHRIVEGTGMGSLTISGFRLEPRVIRLSVSRAGGLKSLKCTVNVGEESATASTAALDCAQTGADQEQTKRLGGEAIAIVAEEHVRAVAEGRPYNVDAVADKMIAFVSFNGPAMAAATLPKIGNEPR
jgi:hypothetical protein